MYFTEGVVVVVVVGGRGGRGEESICVLVQEGGRREGRKEGERGGRERGRGRRKGEGSRGRGRREGRKREGVGLMREGGMREEEEQVVYVTEVYMSQTERRKDHHLS